MLGTGFGSRKPAFYDSISLSVNTSFMTSYLVLIVEVYAFKQ